MRAATIARVVDQLRHRLPDAPPDAELLDAFVARRDEAAFAEIVRRHGPKVYAVCRRALGRHQLAEDAYQATFVVLARKADRVRPRSAVGGFLYGVARKAALEAYALSRRRREALVARVPDVPVDDRARVDSDALAALDEEIANLSDALRAAVVLCELNGVGRAEAARQLGIAEGTLSSRLAAARKQLARRLKARGVTGGAALLAALADAAGAVQPPALTVVSPAVSAIARGVFRTMLFTKLKTAAPACAAVVGLALWAVTPAPLPSAPLPKAEPPGEGTLVVGCVNNSKPAEVAALYAPDGTARGFVAVGEAKAIYEPRVSPDGRRLAYLRQRPYAGKPEDRGRSRSILDLYVADVGGKGGPTEPIAKDVRGSFAWAPGGKQLYVSSLPAGEDLINGPEGQKRLVPAKTRLVDVATRTATPVDIPEEHQVCDVTRDGKTVLTRRTLRYPYPEVESATSYLVPLATMKPKMIGPDEEGFDHARFSPDGKQVAGVRAWWHTKSKEKGLFVYDVATDRLAPVTLPKDIPQDRHVEGVAWAPDGKRLAVLWSDALPRPDVAVGGGAPGAPPGVAGQAGAPWQPTHRITTLDPNGTNAKLVREFKARAFDYLVYGLDWADLGRPGAAPGR
jgi:RNA polymerase sigma factor (sigma-70 family)